MDQFSIRGSISNPDADFSCNCIDVNGKIHVICETSKEVKFNYDKIGYDDLWDARLVISGYRMKGQLIFGLTDKNNTLLDLSQYPLWRERIYKIHEFQYESKYETSDQQLSEKLLSEFKNVARKLMINVADDINIFSISNVESEKLKDYIRDLRIRQKEAIEDAEEEYTLQFKKFPKEWPEDKFPDEMYSLQDVQEDVPETEIDDEKVLEKRKIKF